MLAGSSGTKRTLIPPTDAPRAVSTETAAGERRVRVGLVGMGYIGSALHELIRDRFGALLEVAFVFDLDPGRLEGCRPEEVLDDLGRFGERQADLIVEAATAEVTRAHGLAFLAAGDYLPLSLSALVDPALERALSECAEHAGTRLLIPHGALAGLEGLEERRGSWESVTVTFRKDPLHIDFASVGGRPEIDGPTTLVDGSVREAARAYPRNLNAMIAAGLASGGLDRCRGIFVAEPGLDVHVAELDARAVDGSELRICKRQRIAGVSGTELPDAVIHSILRATSPGIGMQIV
ncbi:MAG: DUF108 domain-containing protein [Actinobacteria bacterium]|nr:DUF108 domain-containing protein [Actinomycetota bacterium]